MTGGVGDYSNYQSQQSSEIKSTEDQTKGDSSSIASGSSGLDADAIFAGLDNASDLLAELVDSVSVTGDDTDSVSGSGDDVDAGNVAAVGDTTDDSSTPTVEDAIEYMAYANATGTADDLTISSVTSDDVSSMDLSSLTPAERSSMISYLSSSMSGAQGVSNAALSNTNDALSEAQADGESTGVISDATASDLGDAATGLVAAGAYETATVGAMQAVLDSGDTEDPDADAATVAAASTQADSDLATLSDAMSAITSVVSGSNAEAEETSAPTYTVAGLYSGNALIVVMAAMVNANSVTSNVAEQQNEASTMYQNYVTALSNYAQGLVDAESGTISQMGSDASTMLAVSQQGGWWDDIPIFGFIGEAADGSASAPEYSGLLEYCQSSLTQQGSQISLINSNISNVSNTINEISSSASNSASAVQTLTSLAESIADMMGTQMTNATTLS